MDSDHHCKMVPVLIIAHYETHEKGFCSICNKQTICNDFYISTFEAKKSRKNCFNRHGQDQGCGECSSPVCLKCAVKTKMLLSKYLGVEKGRGNKPLIKCPTCNCFSSIKTRPFVDNTCSQSSGCWGCSNEDNKTYCGHTVCLTCTPDLEHWCTCSCSKCIESINE